ncbi:MAG: peroxiredoxin [Chloroherpetonaceae bacterium]
MKPAIILLLLAVFVGCSKSELNLKEGDLAPDFTLLADNGESVSLSALKGTPVVLYFYPKDFTPGCTKEACAFRDAFSEFQAAGVEVLGVSVDDVASHQTFKSEHNLNFRLLADTEKKVSTAYGVLSAMGFSNRITFLIDREGKIKRVFKEVKPDEHAAEVLAVAKTL